MLNYGLFKKPLLDPDKLVFNKGAHQFESLEDVAKDNPEYLEFLISESNTDMESIYIIQDFICEHPDYFEEV